MRAVLEHVVGAGTAARFAVFAGDVVPAKKPDPGIYLLALERARRRTAPTRSSSRTRATACSPPSAPGLRCVVTLSSYTGEEDMREAVLVVTSLGDPGEPARVVANRSAARPGEQVTLADLEACLTEPLQDEEAV